MKLIVGLGNPGPRYAGTRHNAGFDVVDVLAARWRISLAAEKFHAWFGVGDYQGERVALMKPTTYMNRSGQAVLAAGQFYKLDLSDLMVVVDDHALPVGKLRIRKSGSSGGHNGLEDIITRLGSDAWCRLRVGIGEPVGDMKDYVTSGYHESERPIIAAAMQRAAEAVECWVKEGPDSAMNRFNIGEKRP